MEESVEISFSAVRSERLYTQLKEHAPLKHDYFEQKPKFREGLCSLGKHGEKTLMGFATTESRKDHCSMSGIEDRADIHATEENLSSPLLTVSG